MQMLDMLSLNVFLTLPTVPACRVMVTQLRLFKLELQIRTINTIFYIKMRIKFSIYPEVTLVRY